MARFARDCLARAHSLTKKLEVALGPDTGDLCMRIGLHSGPVTAGVLRGERSRFQLFGDTMNTASRMESTGLPNKIQISQETAELLATAGKESWFTSRNETVTAKGKGKTMVLYLLRFCRPLTFLQVTSKHFGCSLKNCLKRPVQPPQVLVVS